MISQQEVEDLMQEYPNIYWDGWTLCVFVSDPDMAAVRTGKFKFGSWGQEYRYDTADGETWPYPREINERRKSINPSQKPIKRRGLRDQAFGEGKEILNTGTSSVKSLQRDR